MAKNKVYVGAQERSYTSIYGYPKFAFPVIDAETGANLGYIKQEVVPGLPGEEDTTVYYEKNNWRAKGQPRFYSSPEALLEYVGFTIDWTKNDVENGIVPTRAKKAAKKAKPRQKKVVKTVGPELVAA